MFVRVNTVTGVTDVDASVAMVRDRVAPVLRDQKGYRGLTISGNRETGEVGVLTRWDSMADLDASESAIAHLRDETVQASGGKVTVSKMEEAVTEAGSEPLGEGCSLRILELSMDPAIVDDQINWFRENVVPELKAAAGFRFVRLMIDRKSGKGLVGSVWSDDETMHAGEAAAKARQASAKQRGVDVIDARFRKVLFTQTN